jgi:hypothetical protein
MQPRLKQIIIKVEKKNVSQRSKTFKDLKERKKKIKKKKINFSLFDFGQLDSMMTRTNNRVENMWPHASNIG